jgi:hypothetical protein
MTRTEAPRQHGARPKEYFSVLRAPSDTAGAAPVLAPLRGAPGCNSGAGSASLATRRVVNQAPLRGSPSKSQALSLVSYVPTVRALLAPSL